MAVASRKEAEDVLDRIAEFEAPAEYQLNHQGYDIVAWQFIEFVKKYNDIFVRFHDMLLSEPERSLTAYTVLKNLQVKLLQLKELGKIPLRYEDHIELPFQKPEGAEKATAAKEKAIVGELVAMSDDLEIGRSKIYKLAEELEDAKRAGKDRFLEYSTVKTDVLNYIHVYNLKVQRLAVLRRDAHSAAALERNASALDEVVQKINYYRSALSTLLSTGVIPAGWSKAQTESFAASIQPKYALVS